jgi:hypothetical protein
MRPFHSCLPREQVIGNAVPVKLAEYVAKRLASYIEALEEEGLLPPNGQMFEPKKAYKIAWPKLSETA